MKRFKYIAVVLVVFVVAAFCSGYITVLDDWYISNGGFSAPTVTDYMIFTPTTVPESDVEGYLYWDDTANAPKWYNGSEWVTAGTTASGTSLDGSYDLGSGITVDNGAVTLTTTDAANNAALAIVQEDTANTIAGMTVTSAGDGPLIDFDSNGTGADIDGSDSTWSVTKTGLATFVGLTVTTEDIELENGAEIQNVTDTEIRFLEDNGVADEDLIFDFGTNVVNLKSGTGVDELAMGTVDDLTGVGSITFDDAASTITLTSTGATDLTISQSTADQDASLILQSSGTGTDALSLRTFTNEGDIKINSADNIDIDAADDITIDTAGGALTTTVTGGDYSIDVTNKSFKLDSGEAAADAIWICATDAAGGINVDAGTGNIDVDITNGDFLVDCDLISIDGTGTSNVTVTSNAGAEDFTIALAGATDSSLILSSTGTAADALQITTSAGGIDITNGGASGEDLDIDGVLSAVTINSDEATTDAIDISASAGGITMTSTAVASSWTHTSTGAADDLTLSLAGATNSSLIISSAGTGEDALSLLATGTSASNMSILIDTADGGITMTADGAAKGDIVIDAADDVTITAAGKTTMNFGAEASTWQGNFLPATIVKQTLTTGAVTSADCGYVNQISADAQTITLPATASGLEYTFMCTAADGTALLTIELDNADKFIGAGFTPDDGEAMTLPKATQNYGDYIKLSAHADGWIITEMVGTWAEATP